VAVQRKGSPGTQVDPVTAPSDCLERLTNLVALLLVKGESQQDQIRVLAAAGYGNSEIAGLLGTTPNAVTIALHRMRRKR
jgi:hypothetical protein